MGQFVEALTVKQVAALEKVSPRMAQRYISEGYQGHRLPAARVGKSFQIAEPDYHAWRIACGFEQPEPESRPLVSTETVALPGPAPAPLFPPWPQAADPNGELTNAPHERSRNFPHPEACRLYMEEQLRKQQTKIRGYADEN